MDIFSDYAYFWGSLIGIILVIIIWFYKPELRKRILINGILVAVMGVILEFFFYQDYWIPPLAFQLGRFGGLEDVMFGFTAGAIGSSFLHLNNRDSKKIHLLKLISLYFITLLIQILFIYIGWELNINSIYSSSLGFLLIAFILLIQNRKLFRKFIIGGILGGLILVFGEGIILQTFASDYLEKYFLLHDKISVAYNFLIPTEFIWGICFGAFMAIIYDSCIEK